MMRSPRLTERVSRISSEPRAIVSTTAAVVSVIPARLIGESRSRSHPEATRATTTGAAAPMIPALADSCGEGPRTRGSSYPRTR